MLKRCWASLIGACLLRMPLRHSRLSGDVEIPLQQGADSLIPVPVPSLQHKHGYTWVTPTTPSEQTPEKSLSNTLENSFLLLHHLKFNKSSQTGNGRKSSKEGIGPDGTRGPSQLLQFWERKRKNWTCQRKKRKMRGQVQSSENHEEGIQEPDKEDMLQEGLQRGRMEPETPGGPGKISLRDWGLHK